jgi:hypothetical protein
MEREGAGHVLSWKMRIAYLLVLAVVVALFGADAEGWTW